MRRLAISLGLLCLVCSLAGGATTNQISQYGITWTFNGQYEYGQFANGDYWVLGPLTITSISPGSTESGGRTMNGSMLNPSTTGMTQGYDSAMYGAYGPAYSASLNVALDVSSGSPLVLPNGSSVVSSISHATAGVRPQLSDAAVLTVLSSAPAAGSFRPPYFGTGKTIQFNKSDLDYSKLPQLTAPASAPTISSVEGGFARVWPDHVVTWTGRYHHPSNNMPDYGRDIAMRIGSGMLVLLLDYTDAEKETLLVRMTQLGIDLFAILEGGGVWEDLGGHMHGRKLPILLAGLVLDDSDMLAMGVDYPSRFQEDRQTWIVTQYDVGRTLYTADGRPREEYIQSDVGIPEWGEQHTRNETRDGRNWGAYYRRNVGHSILAHVLTANILGLRDEWNWEPLFLYLDRYWGIEQNVTGTDAITTFHKDMWSAYRYTTTDPTVAKPVITPDGGTFSSSVDAAITCSTSAATIYYTTNGSTPTTSSTQYTGPITISSTTTLKAIGVKSGMTDSSVASATFTIVGNLAPTANAGPDQYVTDTDDNGSQSVTLNGSGSSDSDGTISSYVWKENSSQIATGSGPSVTLNVGAHTIELTVTDDDSATDTDTVLITVAAPGAITSSTGWQSFAITPQTDAFTFEFDVMPLAADMDGTVGLCNGIENGYSDLACILRFNTSGNMDVRDGGVYDADATAAYSANTTYHVRMEVDIPTHTYDVYVTPSGQSEITLASGYAFRTEQASVTGLDHWALVHISGGISVDDVEVTAGTANVPPVANAGSDQAVNDTDDNGSESVTLNGSGSSDSDGTITSYIWTESSVQIATGSGPSVTLAVGSHIITLTVTDDDAASDTDTVTITVNVVANSAPTANAGSDQNVDDDDDSGAESVTLNGSGSTDSDGTIVSYVWKESSTQIATGVSPAVSLSVGGHTIDLTVTDNDDATDDDSVSITVNAYQNVAPVADAGPDQTVIDVNDNGSESVTLDGTGSSDSDGTIAGYVWKEDSTQIATGSGPSVTLDVGSHTIELTVTDDDDATDADTVAITVNSPGSGEITFDAVSSTSSGTASTTLSWSHTIGSGSNRMLVVSLGAKDASTSDLAISSVTFDGENMTHASGSTKIQGAGTRAQTAIYYMLDTDLPPGGSYTVVVTYAGSVDKRSGGAISLEGVDQSAPEAVATNGVTSNTISSSITTVTDGAWVVDVVCINYGYSASWTATGTGMTERWDVCPGSHTAAGATTPVASAGQTTLSWDFSSTGNQLAHSMASFAPAAAPTNEAPTADAGTDQTVTDVDDSGSESVSLDGSGSSDSDGNIVSYVWKESTTQIATGVQPSVSLTQGSHTITLTVTDDDDDTDSDTVAITVNDPPIANAGSDQTVTDTDENGSQSVTLDGSGSSDSDGSIAGYVWKESTTQIATGSGPSVTLDVGTHTIDLTVTDDDDATDTDSVVIDVNDPPTANAGSDQSVDDGDDGGDEAVTLDGSASSDSDGTIAGYVWEESSTQIATGVSPTVTLDVDAHTIDLTVTDDDGATDSDSVTVTVNAYVNIGPTADAGPDQILTDNDETGAENVTLDGSGSSDDDGVISSYIWKENSTQIATGVSPTVSRSTGDHTIELTVTDDDDATDTDTVVITVNTYVNQTPVADAGPDQLVTDTDESGSESVTLDGSGSADSDGTISSYVWKENSSQIATGSGPNVSLTVGAHTIELTVTDDDSATDTDTVVVVVNDPPSADAGSNQTVTDTDENGSESVTLDGSGSSDSDGSIVSYVWKESTSQIATGSGPSVTLVVGAHTIDLTVTDDDGATDSDTVMVTVNEPSAGSGEITFDAVSSTSSGTASTTLSWSHTIGSGSNRMLVVSLGAKDASTSDLAIASVTFDSENMTHASGSTKIQGAGTRAQTAIYYMLDADLPSGGSYTVSVTYAGSVDKRSGGAISLEGVDQSAPEAVATDGVTSDTISSSITTVTDGAWVVDVVCINYGYGTSWTATGTGMTERWDVCPGSHTAAGATTPVASAGQTTLSWDFSSTGNQLAHSMASFAPAAAPPANAVPVADAGPDQSVTDTNDSGDESVTLDGSGSTDSDGSIASYVWKEDTTQIATGSGPSVTLDVGTHTIELTVTDDDDATDTDTVVITVNAYTNQAPSADAGADQTVTDTDADGDGDATLNGAGSTDADGTISSYVWKENSTQIATGSSPSVTLDIGIHTIELTVTDDDSATDTDTVEITVVSRTLTSNTSWQNSSLPAQTGTFTIEFDATPNGASIDGVTGLSSGAAAWYSDMACIVRFYTNGQIEARDGSVYTNDTSVPYAADVTYHVEMVIDVPNDTYTIYVTPSGGSQVTLGTDYSFRTDQLGVGTLDNWSINAPSGSHEVSNLTITD